MPNLRQPVEQYPWPKIIPRWFLGAVEIGLSTYLVMGFHLNLGLFFLAWWVVSLFLLLPLIRCTSCHYYGKRCNTAWGLYAGFAFERAEPRYFQAGYALTVLLWPLRLLPLGIGLLEWRNGFSSLVDLLMALYVLVIVLHRVYYRAANCPVCHQQHVCPVYDPRCLARQPVTNPPQQ